MVRVLVCGSRDYQDAARMAQVMSDIWERWGMTVLIHGAYRGADTLADAWAVDVGMITAPFPADWNAYGGAAGPIRNQQMIDEGKPNLVIAFPGGRGTADMIARSHAANIKVIEVK